MRSLNDALDVSGIIVRRGTGGGSTLGHQQVRSNAGAAGVGSHRPTSVTRLPPYGHDPPTSGGATLAHVLRMDFAVERGAHLGRQFRCVKESHKNVLNVHILLSRAFD